MLRSKKMKNCTLDMGNAPEQWGNTIEDKGNTTDNKAIMGFLQSISFIFLALKGNASRATHVWRLYLR